MKRKFTDEQAKAIYDEYWTAYRRGDRSVTHRSLIKKYKVSGEVIRGILGGTTYRKATGNDKY